MIDFEGINTAALKSARSLLPILIPGGAFRSLEYVVKNPRRADQRPGSFSINYRTGAWKDFSNGDGGSDLISLVAYLRGSGQGEAARELADKFGVPALKSNGTGVLKPNGSNGHHASPSPIEVEPSTLAAPKVFPWGDGGPQSQSNEIRRHAYLDANGATVRIKIKYADGRYIQWFRVAGSAAIGGGWQAKKPDDFQPTPYVTEALNPFDSELKNDEILWPEGEKDVDTLNNLNLPAFTFGGVGDGLPSGIDKYLGGRNLVILADNDDPGREHAEKKAVCAQAAGAASIKIVEFPELSLKGDVSDFVAAGGTADQLNDRAGAAALWKGNDSATATEQDSRSRTASGSESATTSLVIRVASEIEAEPVTWLWQSRIAVGKQTLIAGDPGLGKSQLTAYLAAVVTTGGHWPCDEGRATQGSVVIFSAEDDPADTIVPRLLAAGADLGRVRIVEAVTIDDGKGNKSRRMFHLQADLARLETVLAEVGDVRLVIIDPITAYLGGVDTHRNSDVRGVLGVVAEMAARHRVAVVVVSHWNKSGIGTAVNRVTGSGAFTAAVRAAFMVAKDPEDDERRLFVAMKNNLARIDGGLAFRIEQHMVGPGNAILASAIVWDSERVTRTADQILAAAEDVGVRSAIDEAVDWLRDLLAGNPMPAKDVQSEGDAAGYSWATLKRAKQAAAIGHFREGGAADRGRWFWRLPPPETLTGSTKAYLAQEKDVSQLGKFEPVSEMEPSRSTFDTEGGRQ